MCRTRWIPLASVALAVLVSGGVAAAEDTLDRALSLVAEQRYSEAREALDPFLERDPGHPRARLLLGILDARTGRVSDAIRTFKALLRDHPAMFEPYNNLAVLYAVQGRLDEARETLLAALEHQPAAVVYANLGDVYTDLARRAYLRARSLENGSEEVPASDAATVSSGGEQDRVPDSQEAGDVGADPSGGARERSGACILAGGFESLDAVAGAVEWLRAHEVRIVAVRLEEERSVTSWRVFLPPFESHERAAETVHDIQRRGVRDVAIIGDGDLKHGVSFGVYRDEKNMRRRVSALEALGYSARSVPVEVETADEYVIEADAPAAFEADWKVRFPEHPVHTAACSDIRASQ